MKLRVFQLNQPNINETKNVVENPRRGNPPFAEEIELNERWRMITYWLGRLWNLRNDELTLMMFSWKFKRKNVARFQSLDGYGELWAWERSSFDHVAYFLKKDKLSLLIFLYFITPNVNDMCGENETCSPSFMTLLDIMVVKQKRPRL